MVNARIDIAMLPLLFILSIFLTLRFATSSEASKRFRLLSWTMFTTTLFEVLSLVADASDSETGGTLLLLFRALGVATIVFFLLYLLTHRKEEAGKESAMQTLLLTMGLIPVVIAIVTQTFYRSISFGYVLATVYLFILFFAMEAPVYRQMRSMQEELQKARLAFEESSARFSSASRAKSDFLANTSHEIRTPMNAILGMNDMIQRESQDAEVLKASHDVKRAGETLLNIINNILDISKFDSGRMEAFPVEFYLSGLIYDIQKRFEERIAEKGVTFHVEINKDIREHLFGDAESIERVVSNLLDNAVKYTDAGSISLQVLSGGPLQKGDEEYREDLAHLQQMHLQIMVEDTGIGMRKEEMEPLFEAFERVNLRETQNIQGAGLGLTLVRYMVHLMNGRIRAESVYGEGSAFTVDLPVGIMEEGFTGTVAEYEAKYGGHGAGDTGRLAGMKALIVDDTPVNLIVAEGILQGLQMETETADSGEACLEKLKEKTYDVVFLDHQMPGMDGVETLKRAKEMTLSGPSTGSGTEQETGAATASASDPVFIALTANTGPALRAEYKAMGFDDYLSKPMTAEAVLRVL